MGPKRTEVNGLSNPPSSTGKITFLEDDTVNVEIFEQYIFSCISRSVLGARKYDASEKMNHYSANRINC